MSTNTINYSLVKPELNETADIQVINDNMDIIDIKLKEIDNKASNITIPVTKVNNKTGDVVLTATDIKAADGTTLESFKTSVNTSLAEKPTQTTSNITYYVDTANGTDTNDGLTSGTAFKTIMKAISLLPQIVNHLVTINIAQGTYSEDVQFYGFVGKGSIFITGGNSVSSLYKINSLAIYCCTIPIAVTGLETTKIGANGFSISNSIMSTIDKCKASSIDTVYACVAVYSSSATISNSQLDNHGLGIRSANGSIVYSNNNTGTGNTYALSASSGGTICKNGTQPGGTTAENTSGGGVIR